MSYLLPLRNMQKCKTQVQTVDQFKTWGSCNFGHKIPEAEFLKYPFPPDPQPNSLDVKNIGSLPVHILQNMKEQGN